MKIALYRFQLFLKHLWTICMMQIRKTARFVAQSFREELFFFHKELYVPINWLNETRAVSSSEYVYSCDSHILTTTAEHMLHKQPRNCHTIDILEAQLLVNDIPIYDLTDFFQNTYFIEPPPLLVWIGAWMIEQKVYLSPSPKYKVHLTTIDGIDHTLSIFEEYSDEKKIWDSVHTPFQMHRQVDRPVVYTPLGLEVPETATRATQRCTTPEDNSKNCIEGLLRIRTPKVPAYMTT